MPDLLDKETYSAGDEHGRDAATLAPAIFLGSIAGALLGFIAHFEFYENIPSHGLRLFLSIATGLAVPIIVGSLVNDAVSSTSEASLPPRHY